MSRYEFSFVVTDVELSKEHLAEIDRAVVLAGTSALGAATPSEAITAPLMTDEFVRIHWCGIIAGPEVPPEIVGILEDGIKVKKPGDPAFRALDEE